MNSKKPEDVRKRRAKPETSSSNVYQKMILVAGVLTLFLAIGLSPMMAPILAAGIVGGTLLLFLIFKNLKERKEGKTKAAPPETFPGAEEVFEPESISPQVEGRIIANSREVISEQDNSEEIRESIPPEPEKAVTLPETRPVGKEDLSPVKEFSNDGVLAQIQERLAMLEEKVARLKDRMADLEEKAAGSQAGSIKSEPKIDLQTILAHLDEKEGKVV